MSSIVLIAALWCGASDVPAGAGNAPANPASSPVAPTTSAASPGTLPPVLDNPAPAKPPEKKGFFGSMRDRVLGRPGGQPTAGQPASAKQPAAAATPTVVQTKAETPAPPRTDNPPQDPGAAKATPGGFFSGWVGGERKKTKWTGN
jgi:hypothetical protein